MYTRVTISANELLEKGVWDEACKIKGISIWAVNEGVIHGGEEFTFTEEEAKLLGIIE